MEGCAPAQPEPAPPVGATRMSSTQEAIYTIIAKTCSIDRSKITMESTLKDLDVHSLDAVQVLFEIEDRFDITVPEREDQYSAGTVRDLIEGVDQLLAAKAAGVTPAPSTPLLPPVPALSAATVAAPAPTANAPSA
jgi:acyl carrier protein